MSFASALRRRRNEKILREIYWSAPPGPLDEAIEALIVEKLTKALQYKNGNQRQAAHVLRITPNRIAYLMVKYGIPTKKNRATFIPRMTPNGSILTAGMVK